VAVAVLLEPERSQLNGDLLTGGGATFGGTAAGGGGGCDVRGGGTSSAEEVLGGRAGLDVVVVVEAWELVVEDRENRFAMDSTIDVDAKEGPSACAIGSFEGGRSSMSETSSKEVVEMRRLRGDLTGGNPASLTEPFAVVAGVIDG
jgi:hypothetical protein